LIKNRGAGSLATALIGPYTFVEYKDFDGYACILEDENGYWFDCSVVHLVLIDKRRVVRNL
jgi:hypothetical protein